MLDHGYIALQDHPKPTTGRGGGRKDQALKKHQVMRAFPCDVE